MMYRSKDLALVSSFAAILIGLGFVSAALRSITRTTELFFLISALFAILALVVEKIGTVTLVGTVSGLVFVAIPGAPFPIHVATAMISNAVVFDLYLVLTGGLGIVSTNRIATAAAAGSIVMAVATLAVFQILGTPIPLVVWILAPALDTAVGYLGARFGLSVARRIRSSTEILRRT